MWSRSVLAEFEDIIFIGFITKLLISAAASYNTKIDFIFETFRAIYNPYKKDFKR